MDECIICYAPVDEENAPVLEMGAYGHPKYLCPDCAGDIDDMTLSTDLNVISDSMTRMAKKIESASLSEKTFETLTVILESAAKRAVAIKEGTYDFSLDEKEEGEGLDEIPEELLETEEDRELDKKDEERAEKNNRIFDYITFAVFIGIAAFFAWRLIEKLLL